MQSRSWVFRSVWSAALFGSVLAGCGGEGGVNPEGSESAELKIVVEASSPTEGAPAEAESDLGQAPDRMAQMAGQSCWGIWGMWNQWRPAWNNNSSTEGTYHCGADLPAKSHGTTFFVRPYSPQRTGGAYFYCNNGTWQLLTGSWCDGKEVSTAAISGITTVCSHSSSVNTMWIGWYVADLKRCPDVAGLDWWVNQYLNNSSACTASNNYDGYGDKDSCWRGRFRAEADANGRSFSDAQWYGHIVPQDELNLCGSSAAYPYGYLLPDDGEFCKYKPK